MEVNAKGFVFLPSNKGDGVMVRRDQIVGARPNGHEGSILYTEAGPSIYTALTTVQLAKMVSAELVEHP